MRHPYRTAALAVVAVVLLSGCTVIHTFQLLLTVTNAEDGKPVEGAAVVLDTLIGAEENKAKFDGEAVGQTDAAGKLAHEFKISGYTDKSGPWYLKVRKDGFEPQVIDISPKKYYSNNRETIALPVEVKLKPLPKQP